MINKWSKLILISIEKLKEFGDLNSTIRNVQLFDLIQSKNSE
jgi:hypothetical protein